MLDKIENEKEIESFVFHHIQDNNNEILDKLDKKVVKKRKRNNSNIRATLNNNKYFLGILNIIGSTTTNIK